MKERIRSLLKKNQSVGFALYCITFSFTTYFCMYAFRKPFTVGRFEGSVDLGSLGIIDWKIVLILAQVFGYTLSKFMGIKFVSESQSLTRGRQILLLIGFAELALLGFAVVEMRWKWFFLFLNGIPLGMIWGLVFSYLEGRYFSTLFGTALSTSFIVGSGVVKSVGRSLLNFGISESWMPFITGLCFAPVLWISVACLDLLPPPTPEEENDRVRRHPMDRLARRKFMRQHWISIVILTTLYMILTAYRDFRDNFAREIWDSLNYGGNSEIFSATEIPITLLVLLMLGSLVVIRDVRQSFNWMYGLMAFGVALIGLSTFLFQTHLIGPLIWMTASGLGLFLAYVPFGCIFYDNLIALTGFSGTAGFMIYVSDAFGYLGSIAVMLYKNFSHSQLSWIEFFVDFSYCTALLCCAGFLGAWIALKARTNKISCNQAAARIK